jgi:hypothetical protein
MRWIRARASDWRPGNPAIKPGVWFIPVLFAGIIMLAIVALVGSLANGNGSPFLS